MGGPWAPTAAAGARPTRTGPCGSQTDRARLHLRSSRQQLENPLAVSCRFGFEFGRGPNQQLRASRSNEPANPHADSFVEILVQGAEMVLWHVLVGHGSGCEETWQRFGNYFDASRACDRLVAQMRREGYVELRPVIEQIYFGFDGHRVERCPLWG